MLKCIVLLKNVGSWTFRIYDLDQWRWNQGGSGGSLPPQLFLGLGTVAAVELIPQIRGCGSQRKTKWKEIKMQASSHFILEEAT